MASLVFSTLSHFVLLACYFYTFIYYKLEVVQKIKAFRGEQARQAGLQVKEGRDVGGDLKFLTIWNLVSMACMGYAVLFYVHFYFLVSVVLVVDTYSILVLTSLV